MWSFIVPGTPISLQFSNLEKNFLSQGELDMCVIEGFAEIFDKVIAKGKDGFLPPPNTWSSKYGNTVINLEDFCPPTYRMSYLDLVTALRGIALFANQGAYLEMHVDVWNKYLGHVGTGDMGSIVPGMVGLANRTSSQADI